jgi:hypothetical protein
VSAGVHEAIWQRGREIEVVFGCGERGVEGDYIGEAGLGEGLGLRRWRVDQTAAVQGRVRGGLLREVADDMQAPPVGICGGGGHTDLGATALAGWAGSSAWTE